MKKTAINILVDIDSMELIADERESETAYEVTWDVGLSENDELLQMLWSESNGVDDIFYPKWLDTIKMEAFNVKTQERLSGEALYQKLRHNGIEEFWDLLKRAKMDSDMQTYIARREKEMDDNQMPSHYELYGPDRIVPQANTKRKIKLSKSQWLRIGQAAGWQLP